MNLLLLRIAVLATCPISAILWCIWCIWCALSLLMFVIELIFFVFILLPLWGIFILCEYDKGSSIVQHISLEPSSICEKMGNSLHIPCFITIYLKNKIKHQLKD